MNGSGRRLYELDALRFLAAFAVMLCHFAGVAAGNWPHGARSTFPELNPAADFGYLGVDLFFVISGFVILMSCWDRRPGDFAISRVVRIFPAYWFAVLLAVAVFLTTGWAVDYGPHADGVLTRLLPNLTMLESGVGAPQMEPVYWTLWMELHFYALVVLLAWWGASYRRSVIFLSAWLILAVFSNEAHFVPAEVIFIPRWAPYFIAGMAFYLIYRFGSNLILWLIITVCWALTTYWGVVQISPLNAWPGVQNYAVPAAVTGIFVIMGLAATHRLSGLRWSRLATFGGLTYPLYLLHETVSRPIIRTLAPQANRWAVLGIATAAVLVVAYAVHRLIEIPGQRLLRVHLSRALAQIRLDGTPAAVAEPEAHPGVDRPEKVLAS